MKRFSTLILVTANYPFRNVTEEPFIGPETEHLAREFERVFIIPTFIADRRTAEVRLPENVKVVTDFADITARRAARLRYAVSPTVAAAAADAAMHGMSPLSAATYAASALAWKNGFERFIADNAIDLDSTLFYTFWLDFPATALAMIAASRPLNLISRIHGYELRETRSPRLKRLTVGNLQALYPVSRQALDQLRASYPESSDKIGLHHLGSPTPAVAPAAMPAEAPRRVTFLSVARIVDVKRVNLNLELIKRVAKAMPDSRIDWIHIGDGPRMMQLSAALSKGLPSNLTVELTGARPNSEVHTRLASGTIDWVVLLSEDEGGVPVSLCEAASHGIPAVASNAGGITELVADGVTGVTGDPLKEMAAMVSRTVAATLDRRLYADMRRNAYERWAASFSSEKLREEFARNIAAGKWQW